MKHPLNIDILSIIGAFYNSLFIDVCLNLLRLWGCSIHWILISG
ncbi:hypothetical protein SEHO0A_00849 [Salmonella enterica subsp. houtenae str. ATCC BAA-1581]|nr:hypothetical protein SEHO0A_00849 [Salmonella enterica subsp. houtenae str. ATCC BAA-1581]